jgi:D-lactate dehydrogenase (cytochrome)
MLERKIHLNSLLLKRSFHLSLAGRHKQVPLTAQSYPYLQRRPDFKALDSQDLETFRAIVGSDHVLTLDDDVETFNVDWTRKYKGQSSCVLRPGNAEEIAKILSYCNQKTIAVVPQAGKTGLVGGSVPVFDEIVLSVSRLNDIQNFDEGSGVLTCGAGCILENLDRYLLDKGYLMPLGDILLLERCLY